MITSDNHNFPLIFIDVRPEAQLLAEELICYLNEYHKKYLFHTDFCSGQHGKMLKQLQDNLLKCNPIILVIGENTPVFWLRNRLKFYNKVQTQQKTQLYVKIYGRCSERDLADLDFPNLSICYNIKNCVE